MPATEPLPGHTSASIPPCPLCGNQSVEAYGGAAWNLQSDGRSFTYRNCAGCESMFAWPQPTREEVEWLYANRYDYQWFARRRGLKRIQAWHRWRRVAPLLDQFGPRAGTRRLLDVGGGHAWFLRAAKRAGWQAEGLELLNDDLLDAARQEGLKMHHGLLLDHPLSGEKFDCLTMWHVLEHIPEPAKALEAAADLLAPEGLLVLAVPNFQSLGYRDAGAGWVWCQKPFIHPWHFSATTLRQILPPTLEPVLVTTRDTWDGQWIETTGAYRSAMHLISLPCRAARKCARMLNLTKAASVTDHIQFLAEEGLRLGTYAGYLAMRPVLKGAYEQSLRASELFIVARRV